MRLSRRPGTKKSSATANAISNQGNRNSSTGKQLKRISVVKLREDRNPTGGAGGPNRWISLLRESSNRVGELLSRFASDGCRSISYESWCSRQSFWIPPQ